MDYSFYYNSNKNNNNKKVSLNICVYVGKGISWNPLLLKSTFSSFLKIGYLFTCFFCHLVILHDTFQILGFFKNNNIRQVLSH